jgi:transcriptional regulator with XRE-family HTH domain
MPSTRRLFGQTELRRIGRHVRLVREQAGLPQARVAAGAGLSERALRDFEAGRTNPTLATMAAIAAALSISLDELVFLARQPPPAPDFTPAPGDDAPPVVRLTRGLSAPRMQGAMMALAGGPPAPTPVDGGFVFGHVLGGTVRVRLDGRQVDLGPGDAVHARADAIEGWDGSGRVLVVAGNGAATGERDTA